MCGVIYTNYSRFFKATMRAHFSIIGGQVTKKRSHKSQACPEFQLTFITIIGYCHVKNISINVLYVWNLYCILSYESTTFDLFVCNIIDLQYDIYYDFSSFYWQFFSITLLYLSRNTPNTLPSLFSWYYPYSTCISRHLHL